MQGGFFAGRLPLYRSAAPRNSKGEDGDMLGDGADSKQKRRDDFAHEGEA